VPHMKLLIVAMFLLLAVPAEATNRKGATRAHLDYGTAVKVSGLAIQVTLTNHKEGAEGGSVGDYTLVVKKGKKKVTVASGWVDAPWFEVVAFGKLVQIAGETNGASVTVAPGTKIAKRRISTEKAMTLVEAEADKRGVDYDSIGADDENGGVILVQLTRGEDVAVDAAVGARSRDLLRFEVAPASAATGSDTATATPADYTAILDEHNRVRADHCAPALTWSDELAATAQAWADHLRDASCAFEHSSTEYGENLAAGTSGTLSPADVVAMWYEEISLYNFKKGGFSMDTGHFTQVVWKGTKQVGCGVSQCRGLDVWVCNYDPPGNMDGEYKQNVLPTSCK
jgi:uncharacterized protein YkwD